MRPTYVRPMQGWWKRDPYFLKYMAREVTAFFVAVYAVVLLAGVVRLSQGPEAYAAWLAGLASPWSIALHLVLLAGFAYHTLSWFEIMPKTMPPVVVGGRRLSARTITALGLAAAAVASLGLFVIAWTAR